MEAWKHKLKQRIQTLISMRNQVSAATSVSLGFFTAGMIRAWASPAIPSMQGHEEIQEEMDYSLSYAPLSKEMVSWISSLAPLGALIGGMASSFPLAKFGRKKTLVASSVLFAISFLLLGASSVWESLVTILIARGIGGFGVGLSIPAAQIYVSECTESSIRGTLGSIPALFMALGTLLTYAVGAILPWNFLSYFCAAFPVLMLISVSILPESPSWLLTNKRDDEALASLKWLRNGKEVAKDIDTIKENIENSLKRTAENDQQPFIMPLLQRHIMVPLFLSMALMFFQQWCGVNAVIFYTVTIFSEAGSSIEKNLATILVGLVQFLATFASIFLVDKAGRKILLVISGLIMAMSLSTVATFFYLKRQDLHGGLEFLPLMGLIIFMIGYSVGFASVPYVIMGELFPVEYRNLLGAISSSFNLTHTFLVIKLFTNLQTLVGFTGIFGIYAAISLISCFFVMLFLPETKGKSLEDIEHHFRKK